MKKKIKVKKHKRKLKNGRVVTVKRHSRSKPKYNYKDAYRVYFTTKVPDRNPHTGVWKTKRLDPNMVRAIENLAKNGRREYSASMDLDGQPKTIERIDAVYRGSTGSEEKDGRAKVTIAGTDVTLHTHPSSSSAYDVWNRPSGYDLFNYALKYQKGQTDESYIVTPTGNWIRYYIDGPAPMWLLNDDPKNVDRHIEKKYHEVYNFEKQHYFLDAKQRKMAVAGKLTQDEYLQASYKRPKIKNPELIARRRAFNSWRSWVYGMYNIRIERAKKNKDGSLTTYYRPDL